LSGAGLQPKQTACPAPAASWITGWTKRGLAIAQEPTKMNFGFTFTALDPDGHRLRVYAPAAQ